MRDIESVKLEDTNETREHKRRSTRNLKSERKKQRSIERHMFEHNAKH